MKTLKPLIDSLVKLVKNGVNFVKGQIPDVALQILAFKKLEAIFDLIYMTGITLLLSLGLFVAINLQAWGFVIGLGIATGIATLVYVTVIYGSVLTLIQIKTAPKLFLLEYLKSLLENEGN